MLYQCLGLISVVLSVVAFVPYFISCLKHETKPHMFSWLLWGISGFAVYFGQANHGAGAGAWVVLAESFLCTFIGLYAVFMGEHNLIKSDWWSLVFASMGIGVFCFTDQDALAFGALAIVDLIAFYPTFRKSWRNPYEEQMTLYALSTFALLLSFFSLEIHDFFTTFNLIIIMAVQLGLVAMVLWRRLFLKHAPVITGQFNLVHANA